MSISYGNKLCMVSWADVRADRVNCSLIDRIFLWLVSHASQTACDIKACHVHSNCFENGSCKGDFDDNPTVSVSQFWISLAGRMRHNLDHNSNSIPISNHIDFGVAAAVTMGGGGGGDDAGKIAGAAVGSALGAALLTAAVMGAWFSCRQPGWWRNSGSGGGSGNIQMAAA